MINKVVLAIIILILEVTIITLFKTRLVMAILISFIIVGGSYVFLSLWHQKRMINLIDEDCDPEMFIEKIEKLKSRGKIKEQQLQLMDLNKAVGLVSLGKFVEALKFMDEFDMTSIKKEGPYYKAIIIRLYTDMVTCYYRLGEIEEGNRIYNKYLDNIEISSKEMERKLRITKGNVKFYNGDYIGSEKIYKYELKTASIKRIRLGLIYKLGEIDEINSNIEEATKKYKQVAKQGNKLYIAKKSKEKLEDLKVS